MLRSIAILALMTGSAAAAAETDFGLRTVGAKRAIAADLGPARVKASFMPVRSQSSENFSAPRVSLGTVAGIGSQWGRVTSTYRSPGHNRRVGGVPNSYHLLGRAIDIARRPGVSHWQIAAAYRNAGYHLVESLDEGDHSHFAFGSRGEVRMARAARPQATASGGGGSSETNWGIAYAPGARR